jgi:hypothetical protein
VRAKVAICIPSMSTWAAKTAVCHSELSVYSTLADIAVKTVCQQCSVISMSRNKLTRLALAFDPACTHILWIDSDMTFPADGLERLLAHDKDVVGAFYNRRMPPYTTVGHLLYAADVSKGGLHRADIMPHGFVLAKREVYERLPSPWYSEGYDPACANEDDPDGSVGEDVNFSRHAVAGGIEMWCDADLTFEVGHIGEIVVPCLRPESIKPEMKAA